MIKTSFFKTSKNVFIIFFLTILFSEILLRNLTQWIPGSLIKHLPSSAISKITVSRGLTQDFPPIYKYHPFEKIPFHPYLKIDENGFRNSVFNQTDVDIVLLGDSIIYAQESELDLGDLFRQEGISALNLSIGGYAPQHYRDVYKKYVIEKNIKHKNVIINIFVGNDFYDSTRYPWIIHPPKSQGKEYLPWVINLLIGSFKKYFDGREYYKEIRDSKNQISLPYREIGVTYLWWPSNPSDEEWKNVNSSLSEIINLADNAGALVTVVIIPSPASVYGVEIYPKFSNHLNTHNKIVSEFKKNYKNIEIIDINNSLAKEIEKKFLYTSESETHFNTHGVKIFYEILQSKITSIDKVSFNLSNDN